MQSPRTPTVTIQKHRATNQFYEETLAENVRLRMMFIPEGKFQMGSPDSELKRFANEGPQRLVSVSTFFLGKYPVTQAQWRAVAALPQVKRSLDPDPSNFKEDTRPVEQVSWEDAIEFCARLCEYTKRQYRLPTEVEWEYACRAGTTTPFHFGETLSPELANYNGWSVYGNGPTGENRKETTPVDHFEVANTWGLCDMHGNVEEWLSDSSEAIFVTRGGSWYSGASLCRSACRTGSSYLGPVARSYNLGFRVACSAPQSLRNPAEVS